LKYTVNKIDTDIRLSRAIDGGDTFPSYKISADSFLPTGTVFFVDYIDITAYNSNIYPVWMTLNDGKMAVMIAKTQETDFSE
jgi:hypothetical protein